MRVIHLPSIPHTITNEKYSHCAFTGKVLKFAKMMKPHFDIIHYGVEGSEADCVNIDLITQTEWIQLKKESYKMLKPELTEDEIVAKLDNPKDFIGELANFNTPLYTVFNARLKEHLDRFYKPGDIVCLPFGRSHHTAVSPNMLCVESGIGYTDSYCDFRIFESYAWLHHQLGKEQRQGLLYWFVCPNYFDITQWSLNLKPTDTVGFLGRISSFKGLEIIKAIAERMTTTQFVICGQGDPNPYLLPNLKYKEPIHGRERSDYLGSLCVLLAPTTFTEPFCGVAVEAQLCGTPVVCVEYGAMTETVEPMKTGVFCHTLQDFCDGIALAKTFDREYIRNRAVSKYSLEAVAEKYVYALNTIAEVPNGRGFYAEKSFRTLKN